MTQIEVTFRFDLAQAQLLADALTFYHEARPDIREVEQLALTLGDAIVEVQNRAQAVEGAE